MKITFRQLRTRGACEQQVTKFKALFGASVEVTRALCVKHAADFNFNWAAQNLLSPAALAVFRAKRDALDADYQAKCAPLDADYQAKCAPLYADWQAKRAPLDADYQAKRDALDADYQAKRAPLDADYQAKRALAFFKAAQVQA